MGGVVGALVAIAIAAFVYYKFVYLRRTAEVHPSGERLEEPLLVEGGEAERVTTPVLPAALDFGDDAPLPNAAVAAAVPGWGECYQCKAPVRLPRPPCRMPCRWLGVSCLALCLASRCLLSASLTAPWSVFHVVCARA